MLGRIILCTILAAAIVGGVAWYTGRLPQIIEQPAPSQEVRVKPEPVRTNPTRGNDNPVAKSLDRQVALAAPAPGPRAEEPNVMPSELIVIPEARLSIIRKQEVPAQHDGVLAWIGIEVKPGELVSQDEKIWQVPMLEGNQRVAHTFRRLRIGDVVAENQLLGLVDDTIAQAEFAIANAKLAAARADQTASEKTRDEAKKRWETNERLFQRSERAVSIEDVRAAELTWVRYVYEALSKLEAIKVAEQEKNKAQKQLDMYEIRAKSPGVIKAIYKRDGEAISRSNSNSSSSSSDPGLMNTVLLIHNYDILNVEGFVAVQDARALQQGMKVVVEPTRRERPKLVLKGHRQEITSLAVSKDPQNRLIVSASEDSTVRLWDLETGRIKRVLLHTHPVRAVACTPVGAAANLCLTGTSDGKARLWDLNSTSDQPLRWLQESHRTAVSAVAFSLDGTTCATGSADGDVMVWNVSTGELLHRIPGHGYVVTALHFRQQAQASSGNAPQDLISVSRDSTVRIWRLGREEPVALESIRRRSNDVDQLGVSPDGRHVLDSAGQEMRILSLADGLTEMIFQNPPSSDSTFRTLAQFSPDGRLVLTTSDSESGILQLWRLGRPRTYEFRQLLPTERHPATCAAFDPDGTYVIGGSKDRNVYVWPMPAKDEVEQQLTATLTHIGKEVETARGQVKIIAELQNPPNHPLFSGDSVTLVADPRK